MKNSLSHKGNKDKQGTQLTTPIRVSIPYRVGEFPCELGEKLCRYCGKTNSN